MVGVVTSNSLGLNLGSAAALSSGGVLGQGTLGRGQHGVYVNATTGNLVIQARDELLIGRGADALAVRTYNSLGAFTDDNGDNWLTGPNKSVHTVHANPNVAGATVVRRDADGSEATFTWDAARGLHLSTDGAGAHDTLSYNASSGQWTYVEGSTQAVEVYAAASQGGRLLSQTDPSGNSLSFTYATSGLLSSVTTAAGEVTYYDYTGNQLTQLRTVSRSAAGSGLDTTLTRVRYGYDASNRLETVTVDLSPEDNSVASGPTYVTRYTYDGTSKRVASIVDGDGVSVAITYVNGKVDTVTDGLGKTTSFSYTSGGATTTTATANPAELSTTQSTTTTHALNTGALTGGTGGVPSDALVAGVARSGISGSAGSMQVYRIEVPAGAQRLQIQSDDGSGDADLYLRFGQAPTLNSYDYRSWDSDASNEAISIASPAAGTWYVAVHANTAIQNVRLIAYLDSSTGGTVLQPGVAVTGIHAAAAPANSTGANDLFYRFDVPAGATDVRFETHGLFGDADIYINDNAPADVNNNAFAFYSENGGANELITVGPRDFAISWYIQLRPYTTISDVSLVAYYNLGGNTPPTVNAGAGQYVAAGGAVALSAAAADSGGSVASVAWTQIGGPAVTLAGAQTANASFTAPAVSAPTVLRFLVTATDNQGVAGSDTVEVAVFPSGGQSYVVQAGDTWATIAQTLYGVGSAAAATALSLALGNPALTTGASLSGFPAQLSVTTTVTVPAYYTVRAGDTWPVVTQRVYGTSAAAAIAALQAALGNPALTTGAHLTMPASLTYAIPSSTTANANPAELSTTQTQTTTTTHSLNAGALTGGGGGVPADALVDGVVRNGLGAAAGSLLVYRISVPAGTSVLQLQTDGGSGDADLYVRYGQAPTTSAYDYRSWDSDASNESISVNNPTAGTWYVAVHANSAIANVNLVANLGSSSGGTVLQPGVAITNIHAPAAPAGNTGATDLFYRFDVPAGATDVRFETHGLFGDADLYVNDNAPADVNNNAFAFYSENGGANELITIGPRDFAISWYVQLRPYTAISGVSLVAYYSLGSNTPPAVSAGANQYAAAGGAVALSATANDPGGSVASVNWTQIAGPTVTLAGAQTLNASFTAPAVGAPTVLRFLVTTTDNQGVTASDTVNVAVFPSGGQSYVVQAGDTWATIAQALYGVGSAAAATALSLALGNPALTTGASLSGFPAQLSVTTTTTVTVPAYYTVRAGDTWAAITQRIYGTSEAAAITALQTALGNPSLTAGAHLTVPASITFNGTGGGGSGSNTSTTVTDALNNATTLDYDAKGQLLEVRTTVGGVLLKSTYTYNLRGDVESITDGEGRAALMAYDDWGNLLRQTDGAGHVVRRTYSSTNQLLTETVATLGEPPANAAASRFVYDATGKSLLRFTISAEGRVTEHRYDAQGQRTATIRYALNLYGLSGLASTDVPSEAAVAAWAAAQDRTRTERVDYAYDWRGQITSTTTYANVGSDGIGLLDGGHAVTQFVYDAAGQLLHTYSPKTEATHYTYDGLGRLLTTTNALNQTTVNVYDDANRRVQTTTAAGLLSTSTFDAAGRLVSVQQSGTHTGLNFGQAQNYYDGAGQLRMTRDASGARQWYLYDPAGRRVGTVNALGQLQEYVYDRSGKLTQTIDYATPVDTATLVDGSGNPVLVNLVTVRPAAGSAYRASWNAYDAAGRLAKTVSPLGEVTEFGYDNAGRLITTRRYVNTISTTGLGTAPAASSINPQPNDADRVERSFYGHDGLLLATLDATGGLVEYRYDAAGRATTRLGRATQATAAQVDAGTQGVSDADSRSLTFYNARGQVVAELDAARYLTERRYDENGNLAKLLRYPTQPVAGTVEPTTSLGTLRAGAGPVLEQASYEYDAINRQLLQRVDPNNLDIRTGYVYNDIGNELTVTDALDVKTTTQFDELGRVRVVTVDSAQGGLALQTHYTYDNLGRLKTSTDAAGVVTAYDYDALGRKTKTTVDLGGLGLTTTYAYDRQGNLARVTDANNHQTRYLYDADNRLRYTLDAEYGLVESRYDALGNRTQVLRYADRQTGIQTLDDGAGLIRHTLDPVAAPARDSITRYVVDSEGRVRFEQDALGAVVEYRYDAKGQLSEQVQWHDAIATTTALVAADFSAALGTFDAETDRITRYVHDAVGRVVFEQNARGSVTEIRYDAAGRVAERIQRATALPINTPLTLQAFAQPVPQALDRVVRFVYDAAGRMVYEQDPRGGVTEHRYDKLGRVTESVAYATPIASTTALQPAAFAAALTGAGGVADPAKDRLSRNVYDAAGRRVYQQDALGGVVQYRYDARGLVAERLEWAKRIATTTPLTATAFASALQAQADPLRDRLTRFVYDAAGRLAFQQDALGGVTQYRYDALGQLLERVARAYRQPTNLALTVATFQSAVNANANAALDRSSRHVYDNVGHVRFTVDALGGAVENIYDGQGQLARVIAYDTALSYSAITDAATPQTVRQLLPTSTLGARETIYTYDLVGHVRYTAQSVSATGTQKSFVISENTYDALGQLSTNRAYATTRVLSGLPTVASSADLAALVSADAAKDRTSKYFYFADGRLEHTEDGEGFKEFFTYDALGNKRTHTNRNGATTDYDYDVAGHLVEEQSPLTSVSIVGTGMAVEIRTLRLKTSLGYDTFGQLTSRIEAANVAEQTRTTRYEYDKLGRQARTFYDSVSFYNASADNLTVNGLNGAAIQRTETGPTTLVSETAYNTFGEAIIGRDVAGSYSYKTYDKLGRVVNEVDGNHNVTRHAYSAMDGEYADLMRLAGVASFADGWSVSESSVDAAVEAVLSAGVRNVRTYANRLGQTTRVEDLAGTYSYDSATSTGGLWTRVNTYAYSVWGDLESRTVTLNGSGAVALTRNRYDLAGRMTREINAEGYVTDYRKNAFGDNERVTEYATRLTGTDPDAQPASVLPSSVADAAAYDRITEYTYDRRGMSVREEKLSVQFDKQTESHALVRVWGTVFTSYQFDGAGNVTATSRGSQENGSSTVVDGGTNYQYYDQLGRVRLTRDAANRATSMGYDALGDVVRTTRHGNLAGGGSEPAAHDDDQTTVQRRDRLGRVTETLEPAGLHRYISYDAAGRVAKQWTPFRDWANNSRNAVQLFTYDATGRQLSTQTLVQRLRTDALTYSVETAEHNAYGEVTAMKRDGTTIQQSWYDAGGRLWKTHAGAGTTVFWYDLQDNVTVTFTSSAADNGADLNSPSWSAPADFASLTLAQGVARRTTTFDRLGHSTGELGSGSTHGTLRTTSASQTVDRWGNVLSVTRNGVERLRYRYNALNEVISETQVAAEVWGADGSAVTRNVEKKIHYDAWGRNIGTIDGENHANTARYDIVGQLTTEYHSDGSAITYDYDALGRRTTKSDSIGRVYTYRYDLADRETSRSVKVGTTTYDLGSTTYDELGRKIIEITGADSSYLGSERKYDYDARGLMWRSTTPLGYTTLTWYDNAGRKTAEQDANGLTATWEYAAGSGLLSYHVDLSGIRTDYTYNQLGQIKTQASGRGQSLSYVYFEDGQLKQLSDLYRRSNTQYDYDVDGNRTREIFAADGVVHRDLTNAYDHQGRLINSVDMAYAGAGVPTAVSSMHEFSVRYDAVGNRRRVWGSNADDRPMGRFTYDTWYTYDGMNRVRINGGHLDNGAVVGSTEYVYDAAGRRVQEWWRRPITFQGGDSGYRLEFKYDFADRFEQRERVMLQGPTFVDGQRDVEQVMSYNAAAGTQSEITYWFTTGSFSETGYFFNGMVRYKDTLAITQFDRNGRVASRSEKEEGFAVTIPGGGLAGGGGTTTAMGYVERSRQDNTYDSAGNLSYVRAQGWSPRSTDSQWQVYDSFRSSDFDYRYSYYVGESYLERGQNLQGRLYNKDGELTGYLTPTQSVQEYDANGNVAQVKRQKSDGSWTSTWYVADNAGHIVQSWSNQIRYWNGVDGTTFSQDDTQRIWTPTDATPWSGAASTMAAMPAPALTADATEWNKLTVLFVNDQKIGLFHAGVSWVPAPRAAAESDEVVDAARVPGDPPDEPPPQVLKSYWGGLINVTGLGTVDPDAGSGQLYMVQAGDTAGSLAQRFYGDAGLWYAIADANSQGLVISADSTLPTGTSIRIPPVTRSTNTANSFAVYQPSQIIGSTAPEAQVPPPPSAGGCGAIGTVLVVAVAVVVTAYTAGYAASTLGAASATTSAGVATSLGSAALGAGTLIPGATGFVLGSASATAVAAAAIGGAVGSIAAQGVAMAMGMQDGFEWEKVGLSAIGAGVTSGLGQAINASPTLKDAFSGYSGLAARAAVGNAITQRLAVTTGLQDKFDWRSVRASAIAAPAATFIGDKLPTEIAKLLDPSTTGGQIGRNILNGAVGQRVRVLVTKQGKVDYASIAADAFGNALGDSIVDQMRPNVASGSGLKVKGSTAASWGPQFDVGEGSALPRSYELDSTGVRFGGRSDGSVAAAQQWALEAGLGPRTATNAQALSDHIDWVVNNTDLRSNFQPREAGGGRGFVNPPMAISSDVRVDINEGDPTPLRLRSPGEFRDLGRTVWNGLVGLADFGAMMARGALRLYDRNADGSPNLQSVTTPILDGFRLDYESDSYSSGGLGFFGETLTQTVAPSGLARLPGAVRWTAGELRAQGVPDWYIRPGSPYQLNSIGGGIEFERIGNVQRRVDEFIADVHGALGSKLNSAELAEFKTIDPTARIGLTGSSATGRVGNPNKPTFGQPINMDKFDLDLFVQSDVLLQQFGTKLQAAPVLRQSLVDEFPTLFQGLKPGKAGLSIMFRPHGEPPKGSIIFGD